MSDDQTKSVAANLRTRLLQGDRLLGTMLTLPNGAVAEVLSATGFDWLFVDAEHGPFEAAELQLILQIVGDRTPCLVRVPTHDEIPIKRALDLGAAGIIVPQVNSAEQAQKLVGYCRYAPLGNRGVGIARAQGYGQRFASYVENANEQTTVIMQAEHIRSVENIEDIVAVPGVDGILVGPYDLSASMGLMGQIDHPDVVAAIDRVTQVCKAASKPLGIFGVTSQAVQPYIERGYTLIVVGVDTLMLANGAGKMLRDLRGE